MLLFKENTLIGKFFLSEFVVDWIFITFEPTKLKIKFLSKIFGRIAQEN